MIIINTISGNQFTINGIPYFKNFQPIVSGDALKIVGVYDSKVILSPLTEFSEYEIDGNVYTSVADLQSALLPVLYTRGSLGAGGGGVWSQITGNIYAQQDLIQLVNGLVSTSIENRYTNVSNVNTGLLSGVADQTSGGIQYVEDATEDPNFVVVNGNTYAYYEYLGTNNNSLQDYRLLSPAEASVVESGTSYRTFEVKEKSSNSIVTTDGQKISIIFTGNNVDTIVFDSVFSSYLEGVKTAHSGYDIALKLFNHNTKSVGIIDIASIDWSDVNQSNRVINVSDGLDPVFFNVGDSVEVSFSFYKEGSSGGSGGHVIKDENNTFTQRSNLKFIGGGVSVLDDSANDATEVEITGQEINITSTTGWADYVDGQYTSANPFTLTEAAGTAMLPNNAATVRDSEKPTDLPAFYDGSGILGKNGDAYLTTIEFKVRPTNGASNIRIKTSIDIGGAIGEIYPRDFSLTKGSGNEHFYLSSFGVYTLNTWEANKGTVKISTLNSSVEIYDIRFVFFRLHKAGNQYAQNNSLTVDMLAAIINSVGANENNRFITASEAITTTERNRLKKMKALIPATMSGNIAVDLAEYDTVVLNLTANATIVQSNLPSGTERTNVLYRVVLNGFSLTLPAGWTNNISGAPEDGKINAIIETRTASTVTVSVTQMD